MKKIVVGYLAILFLIISCKTNNFVINKPAIFKNVADTANIIPEIMPLKIGNYWKYLVGEYSLTNKYFVGKPDTVIYFVSDSVIIDNQKWYIFSNNKRQAPVYARNQEDGLWTKYSLNEAPSHFLIYPTEIEDETFVSKSYTYLTTLDNDFKVSSHLGTYSAIKYQMVSRGVSYTYYCYVPGIGMWSSTQGMQIRRTNDKVDTLVNYNELIEFNVK